jgi:putative transcriptional regulator
MVPKRIVCRLEEIMRERRLTQKDLHELSGVDPKSIKRLCEGTWTAVEQQTIGKLCAALQIELHELLQAVPADIWYPIRRSGKVTVHVGSTSLESAKAKVAGAMLDRQGIGTWDVRALFHVYDYLNRSPGRGVVFTFQEHVDVLHDPARVEKLYGDGCHLILGSPIVNPIAEDVVCRGFRVPARSRERHAGLPFRFLWDRNHASSFGGAEDPSTELGIVRHGHSTLVARRTVVGRGEEGEDCGLIFTYRSNPIEGAPEDDDRIIVAIMGHSGCGTWAGTMLACREPDASALYPQQRTLGVLRAFTATYSRPAKDSGAEDSAFDDRVPKNATLVEA